MCKDDEKKIKKTPKQVKKDSKRQKRVQKSHKTNMRRLKKDMLRDKHLFACSPTIKFTTFTSFQGNYAFYTQIF